VVDAFLEQTEASASVDPTGSIRAYMVLEMKETRDGAFAVTLVSCLADFRLWRWRRYVP
jgi:hypothetical protein